MVGYSDTPLLKKLGYVSGDRVLVTNAPDWFLEILPRENIQLVEVTPAEWAHGFFEYQAEVEKFLNTLMLAEISKGIWVSWPKKASKVTTDLTEQTFRDLILPLHWVDIKVAAIDEVWSGLKFTRRLARETA